MEAIFSHNKKGIAPLSSSFQYNHWKHNFLIIHYLCFGSVNAQDTIFILCVVKCHADVPWYRYFFLLTVPTTLERWNSFQMEIYVFHF